MKDNYTIISILLQLLRLHTCSTTGYNQIFIFLYIFVVKWRFKCAKVLNKLLKD